MDNYYVIVKIYNFFIDRPLIYILLCEGGYDPYNIRASYAKQLDELEEQLKIEGIKYASLNVSNPKKLINNIIKL